MMVQPSVQPVLSTRRLVKRFSGVTALKGVTFDLLPGEVHALCGENGAGKSTLIKVLSGVHPAGSYEGEVIAFGTRAAFASTRDAEAAKIAVIHQELQLVAEMTVAENLFLGSAPTRGGLIDWDRLYFDARRLLERCRIDVDPTALVGDLGVGQQQLVEIARALGKDSRVLILDEPTAALTERETAILLDLVRDLKSRGIASIYISHKLDEVFALADRITVLRDGETIRTFETKNTRPAEIIRDMVGREIADLYPRRSKASRGEVILSVRGLTVARDRQSRPMLHGIHFDLHAGEVLGIGGLMGAGRSELLLHLFGAFGHRLSGTVELGGRPLPVHGPGASLEAGLALVGEDRKRQGLCLEASIGFNLSLSTLPRLSRAGLINEDAEAAQNREWFRSLRVKAPDLDTPVGTLSGGNQQKVVIGKALMTEPRVAMLDEPTRGIDVGAKFELYELIRDFADRGGGVVLVSSELPELLGLSDRIVMLSEGRVGGVFERSEATEERLLAAAMGRGAAA